MNTRNEGPNRGVSTSVDPSDYAEELSQLVSRCFIWMEALDRRALRTVTPPLTTPQYHALAALARKPDLSLGDLAAQLLTVKSNASGIVDRLEDMGLCESNQDPVDARRIRLSLTTVGTATLRHAHEARRTALSCAFPAAESQPVLVLSELLRDLSGALQRAVEP